MQQKELYAQVRLTSATAVILAGLCWSCQGKVGDTAATPPDRPPPQPPQPVVCSAGFERVDGICQDVNECMRSTSPCAPNATCSNRPGGFTCLCNDGSTGDGRTCTADRTCDDMSAVLASADNRCTICHDATPTIEGGGLDLLSAGVADRLVNQPSRRAGCDGALLIDAANPSQSLILALVDPQRYAALGDQPCLSMMPLGGNGVSPEDLQCFESWVEELAATASDLPPPPPPSAG